MFMVVPVCVPAVAGRTVVHNTIVYSDTVLNLKEREKNLKVTSVKAESYEFERCLEIILEANPNVVFNTVQYSYKQNRAYFYTDKEITTAAWEKRNEKKQEYLDDALVIACHVEKLLNSERLLNPNFIAIYDVLRFYKKTYTDIEASEKCIKRRMEFKLNSIDEDYYVVIYDMYSDEARLTLVKPYRYLKVKDSEERFWFKKKNGDIYISKRDGDLILGDEILSVIGQEILELYDYQLSIQNIKKASVCWANSVDSDFIVSIYFGVDISIRRGIETLMEISTSWTDDDIDYKCNSNNLAQLLKGNVYNLYRKIFVKIDDCPKWMQEELYEIRRQQVIEEEKERQKKLKKQKRRDFWKKIFPFIKKV